MPWWVCVLAGRGDDDASRHQEVEAPRGWLCSGRPRLASAYQAGQIPEGGMKINLKLELGDQSPAQNMS